MVRSFSELTKRKDDLTALVREVFGDRCVGSFGVGVNLVPVQRPKRKRHAQVDNDSTSDEQVGAPVGSGVVRDILIEAKRQPAGVPTQGIYLTNWEGYTDLDCAWVREGGMSKATKDWWNLESEMRYPGYGNDDYSLYDDKDNSLCYSPSTKEFLKSLGLPTLLGSPEPDRRFLQLITNTEFNTWNFVLALSGETSLDLFFRITETLAVGDHEIPSEEKVEIPEPPSLPPARRRLRLIVSSTSSDEEKDAKANERRYSYRGQPAYLVREIRGERIVRGKIEYHVFWRGYESSEATWEPAGNVNREAVQI